nr:hypothetical protein [uncultured Campylobacter sp.]
MDKLRQRYVALQKAFWDSDGGAASILRYLSSKTSSKNSMKKRQSSYSWTFMSCWG